MKLILVDPSATVPITLTGRYCALNCPHCGGHYLQGMAPVEKMEKYISMGYRSFLISGGLDNQGELPLHAHLHELKRLKEKFGLKYNFHVGFPRQLDYLVGLADVVSFDFFADEQILRRIYNIDYDPMRIIRMIKSSNLPAVPHVTVGIECGRITHEYIALDILKEDFEQIVLNVFIPTPNTVYEACSPPPIEDVVKVFAFARERFKIVMLGCMQPRGEYRRALQRELFKYLDVLVKPTSKRSVDYRGCCSFILIDKDDSEVFKDVREGRVEKAEGYVG